MKAALKNISGLMILSMIIAGLFCAAPSFVEESSHEKAEQVEETYIIAASNQPRKQSAKALKSRAAYVVVKAIEVKAESGGFRSFSKFFILYHSLRLYD